MAHKCPFSPFLVVMFDQGVANWISILKKKKPFALLFSNLWDSI
jgi:hypothetical protein